MINYKLCLKWNVKIHDLDAECPYDAKLFHLNEIIGSGGLQASVSCNDSVDEIWYKC